MVYDYIRYLGNMRWRSLGFDNLFEDNVEEPENMRWVAQYANANMVKTDFFDTKSTAYAKSTAIEDDFVKVSHSSLFHLFMRTYQILYSNMKNLISSFLLLLVPLVATAESGFVLR